MDAQDALASFSPSQIHAEAADFDSFGDQSNLRNPFADFRPLDAHNAADSAAVSDPPLPQSNLASLFDPIAFNQPLPDASEFTSKANDAIHNDFHLNENAFGEEEACGKQAHAAVANANNSNEWTHLDALQQSSHALENNEHVEVGEPKQAEQHAHDSVQQIQEPQCAEGVPCQSADIADRHTMQSEPESCELVNQPDLLATHAQLSPQQIDTQKTNFAQSAVLETAPLPTLHDAAEFDGSLHNVDDARRLSHSTVSNQPFANELALHFENDRRSGNAEQSTESNPFVHANDLLVDLPSLVQHAHAEQESLSNHCNGHFDAEAEDDLLGNDSASETSEASQKHQLEESSPIEQTQSSQHNEQALIQSEQVPQEMLPVESTPSHLADETNVVDHCPVASESLDSFAIVQTAHDTQAHESESTSEEHHHQLPQDVAVNEQVASEDETKKTDECHVPASDPLEAFGTAQPLIPSVEHVHEQQPEPCVTGESTQCAQDQQLDSPENTVEAQPQKADDCASVVCDPLETFGNALPTSDKQESVEQTHTHQSVEHEHEPVKLAEHLPEPEQVQEAASAANHVLHDEVNHCQPIVSDPLDCFANDQHSHDKQTLVEDTPFEQHAHCEPETLESAEKHSAEETEASETHATEIEAKKADECQLPEEHSHDESAAQETVPDVTLVKSCDEKVCDDLPSLAPECSAQHSLEEHPEPELIQPVDHTVAEHAPEAEDSVAKHAAETEPLKVADNVVVAAAAAAAAPKAEIAKAKEPAKVAPKGAPAKSASKPATPKSLPLKTPPAASKKTDSEPKKPLAVAAKKTVEKPPSAPTKAVATTPKAPLSASPAKSTPRPATAPASKAPSTTNGHSAPSSAAKRTPSSARPATASKTPETAKSTATKETPKVPAKPAVDKKPATPKAAAPIAPKAPLAAKSAPVAAKSAPTAAKSTSTATAAKTGTTRAATSVPKAPAAAVAQKAK